MAVTGELAFAAILTLVAAPVLCYPVPSDGAGSSDHETAAAW